MDRESGWGCSILCEQGWRTSGVDHEVKIQTTSRDGRREHLDRGKNRCKGPEVVLGFMCSRDGRKPRVTGTQLG